MAAEGERKAVPVSCIAWLDAFTAPVRRVGVSEGGSNISVAQQEHEKRNWRQNDASRTDSFDDALRHYIPAISRREVAGDHKAPSNTNDDHHARVQPENSKDAEQNATREVAGGIQEVTQDEREDACRNRYELVNADAAVRHSSQQQQISASETQDAEGDDGERHANHPWPRSQALNHSV